MGVWGRGLLQGDSPLDYIYSQTNKLRQDLERLAREPASESAAARLGAVVGLLLQFYPYSLQDEHVTPVLDAAMEQHRGWFHALPARVRAVFRLIKAGGAAKLGARPARGVDRRIRKALGDGMGYREAALFAHPAAAAYAQEFADACVDAMDEEIGCEGETWMDDVEGFMGVFALLLLIEPCHVSPRKIRAWRKAIRAVYDAEKDECSAFVKDYMRNVEGAFEGALEKFSGV
jgi:hypothetical protein